MAKRYHRTAGLDQLAPPAPRAVPLYGKNNHTFPKGDWRNELHMVKAWRTRKGHKVKITLPGDEP